MKYITYSQESEYDIAILTKSTALKKTEIHRYYVEPLLEYGLSQENVVAFDLDYEGKKCSVKLAKNYLEVLMPELKDLGVKVIHVCDSVYFKILTNSKKVEPHYGYILDCKLKGYEDMKVTIGANYQGLFYNPDLQSRIDLANKAIGRFWSGNYEEIGQHVIQYSYYPKGYDAIKQALEDLLAANHPKLEIDIEAFSLKFWEAGIGSIGFAWNQHEGISFAVDYRSLAIPHRRNGVLYYGKQRHNPEVKQLLIDFFLRYEGTIVFHNANYDVKILIYELFMSSLLDMKGMQHGLQTMCKNLEDTKLITYLARNTTAEISLGLKDNAHEFAGNYAQDDDDIKDIRRIPLPQLLEYNLVDCLSTNYVYDKYRPVMIQDNQLDIYHRIFLPSVKMLLHIELCGMPIDMNEVANAKAELTRISNQHYTSIMDNQIVKDFWLVLRQDESDKAHAKWKKKTAPIEDFNYVQFNPGSNQQLQKLLYDIHGLPVIDKTKSKQPAVGAKTLKKLKNHTKDPLMIQLLTDLMEYSKAQKILTTFIVAFEENTVIKEDGWYYLHGSFNLGGTISGRLSSSNPNLQNLPSGSVYGKIIKKCFKAPDGWLFGGADFASLEDRVNTLLTKDPNKVKVYTEKFDGHSLRAYAYFQDDMLEFSPYPAKSNINHYVTKVGKNDVCFTSEDSINYQGKTYTGDGFYEFITSK